MDFLFLGTSSGTPTRTRNVTGLAVIEDSGSAWYLVDCGEGTQHRLLETPLSLNDLRAICITHVHGDHCYGLPGLLGSAGMNGRMQALTIVAPSGIAEWFAATQIHTALHLPFDLHFVAVESLDTWTGNQLRIDATRLSHRVPSYAYGFTETQREPVLDTDKLDREGIPRGPVWGQLRKGLDATHDGQTIKSSDYVGYPRPPRRLIVGGDNDTPSLLTEACRDTQVLVHEATYTQDVAAKVGDVGHSAAGAVAAFAQSVQLPNLVLTHFSPRYQSGPRSPSIEDIRTEAANAYRGELVLAEDLVRYRLAKTGTLTVVDRPREPAHDPVPKNHEIA